MEEDDKDPAHHQFILPTLTLDPPSQDKSNYRCKYDPALDTSLVKKSAGPLYRHSKPALTIDSNPNRDPRLKLAYPSPLSTHPTTPSGRSALIVGLSRSSRTRQAFHSRVEPILSYPYDRNSLGPPPPPPPAAILITMLDKLVTGQQVRSHFSQFGRIAECEIKLDPQTGGSLGICWLRFLNNITHPTADSRHSSSNNNSNSNSSGIKNQGGHQDGHQAALAAVKKANGARIGCMLNMGPARTTSGSSRRPTHYGIRCQLDGQGTKCEQAVAEQLDLLYPPLPLQPPLPDLSPPPLPPPPLQPEPPPSPALLAQPPLPLPSKPLHLSPSPLPPSQHPSPELLAQPPLPSSSKLPDLSPPPLPPSPHPSSALLAQPPLPSHSKPLDPSPPSLLPPPLQSQPHPPPALLAQPPLPSSSNQPLTDTNSSQSSVPAPTHVTTRYKPNDPARADRLTESHPRTDLQRVAIISASQPTRKPLGLPNSWENNPDQRSAILKLPSFSKRKSLQSSTKNSNLSRSHAKTNPAAPGGIPKDTLSRSPLIGDDESTAATGRASSHKQAIEDDDFSSIASSDVNNSHRRRRSSTRESGRFVQETVPSSSPTRAMSDDDAGGKIGYSINPPSRTILKRVVQPQKKRRFQKVTFTSSEEEEAEEKKDRPPKNKKWKRAQFVAEKEEKDQAVLEVPPFHEEPKVTVDEIILDSPLGGMVPSPKTLDALADTELPQEENLLQVKHRRSKKVRLSVKARSSVIKGRNGRVVSDEEQKEPRLEEVAEDEEDLYFVKLALSNSRAGRSLHPPSTQKPKATEDSSQPHQPTTKVGQDRSIVHWKCKARDSSPPISRTASEEETEQKKEASQLKEKGPEGVRRHSTGSSRTEGYYHIPSSQKAIYLPQRNKAIIDVGSLTATTTTTTTTASNPNQFSALALSRSTRVNSRRFILNMEQNKKASILSSGNNSANNSLDSSLQLPNPTPSIDSVADVLKFNQLRTRKKRLKFSRSPIHDWGLYAMETIPAGEMVIEYVGELIRQAVADRREKLYERMGIGSSYLFRVDDDLVVDATKKGNLGRLINHCCSPNCTAKIITINGEKKIVIYAKVAIELGDEVTYDYHFPKEEVKIPCLCGSVKCKGTLN